MNKLINFLKTAAYVIATILSICLVAMTMLTALAAEAPNLTESAKQEALAYTNIKQKELGRGKSESKN